MSYKWGKLWGLRSSEAVITFVAIKEGLLQEVRQVASNCFKWAKWNISSFASLHFLWSWLVYNRDHILHTRTQNQWWHMDPGKIRHLIHDKSCYIMFLKNVKFFNRKQVPSFPSKNCLPSLFTHLSIKLRFFSFYTMLEWVLFS